MAKIENTIRCDGCGAEITLSPVIRNHQEYCCVDCADGLKCSCAERMEFESRERSRSFENDKDALEP